MELKSRYCFASSKHCCVLIVPYGIEIRLDRVKSSRTGRVLIVPYGIEMLKLGKEQADNLVLIVPYGIEIVVIVVRVSAQKGF